MAKQGRKKPHICYYTDGKGSWLRREWKRQCPEQVFLTAECQGVEGHQGVHWYFSPDGSFKWKDNDADPKYNGCGGCTPPGHKEYRSPVQMAKHFFMNHYTDKTVTDPGIIAQLEQDDPPELWASINKPVKPGESHAPKMLS